eukprot:gene6982-7724_t
MIGRLGLGNGGNAQPAQPQSNSSNQSAKSGAAGRSLGGIQSISAITMSKMKFTDITKKVSAGLNLPLGHDQDKKAKVEAEEKERKAQMMQALAVLEDVHLQAPPSHSGIIVAYYGRTMSPVMHPGIRFTWFRMSGEDRVDQVDESSKAWYAPTLDDIGCVICVQCEDNFEQGCSRYLECGPIRADQLLVSASESVVNYGIHETKDVCVSFGLGEGEPFESTPSASTTIPLATVLDRDLPFLQLNGRSHIEVDEQGIFISIPTFQPSAPTTAAKGRTASVSGKPTFNTSRRGLRLPASATMSVSCSQPSSMILRVPIRKSMESEQQSTASEAVASVDISLQQTSSSDGKLPAEVTDASNSGALESKDKSDGVGGSGSVAAEDEKMRQFLSSSILSIPWVYEGHNLSPAAYIAENEARLSPEERERILKEAEEDSIVFANTVCALTEFVSSIPEGTSEIVICFSCTDRANRDLLAVSMRTLACQAPNTTRYDRCKMLPWFQGENEDSEEARELIADNGESDHDLRRRLRSLESEVIELRRERNELTMQLLETRESLATAQKAAASGRFSDNTSSSFRGPIDTAAEDSVHSLAHSLEGEATVVDGVNPADDREPLSSLDHRQLQSKIIDLENKLNIVAKKETELTKARLELEQRNSKISLELEKYKRQAEDLLSKNNSLQALFDRQEQSVQSLEDLQATTSREIDDLKRRIKEVDILRTQLDEKEKDVLALRKTLEDLKDLNGALQKQVDQNGVETANLRSQLESQTKSHEEATSLLEEKLIEASREMERLQDEKKELKALVDSQQEKLLNTKKLEEQLLESEEKADQLAAEMNHLLRKSESQSRDMKKMMIDNAATMSEFEKALVRKSEECNDLYFKINELKDREAMRSQAEAAAQSNNLIAKFASRINTSITNLNNASSHDAAAVSSAAASSSVESGEGNTPRRLTQTASSFFRRLSGADRMPMTASGHDSVVSDTVEDRA